MPNNTKELESLVTKAQEATRNLESAELRKVAFEQVLDHLLANYGHEAVADPNLKVSPGRLGTESEPADGVLASEQQRIDALARYFKISPDEVQHLFDATEEQPNLVVSTKQLASSKAQAAREIALLVTGALTALGLETTTSHVRDVADDYGKYDNANFMTTLTNMVEISVLGKRRSQNRIIRMKVAGVEAAQDLATRIVN